MVVAPTPTPIPQGGQGIRRPYSQAAVGPVEPVLGDASRAGGDGEPASEAAIGVMGRPTGRAGPDAGPRLPGPTGTPEIPGPVTEPAGVDALAGHEGLGRPDVLPRPRRPEDPDDGVPAYGPPVTSR